MDPLNHLPGLVLVTDAHGSMVCVNTDLVGLLGGASGDWVGQSMGQIFSPPSSVYLRSDVFPEILKTGMRRELRLDMRGIGGTLIPVLANVRRGPYGQHDCFYWLFTLVHDYFEEQLLQERQRAQEAVIKSESSERFMRTIANAIPGVVGYWDRNLRCHFANDAYLYWFGKTAQAMLGITIRECLGERLYLLNEGYILGALRGEAQHFERSITKPDGKLGHTLTHYVPDRDASGSVAGFFVLIADVTTIKESQEQLQLAASVYANTGEGIMVTDKAGRIISVNPAFTNISGYSEQEALGMTLGLLTSEVHAPEFYEALIKDIAKCGRFEGEAWHRRKDGSLYLVAHTVTKIAGSAGQSTRYISVFNDVTSHWESNERARHLAFHDPLTNLANRASLVERLTQLVATAQREERSVAVLFLDLDGFKLVNDTYGHAVGDELLQSVARKLEGSIRKSDIAARLGGDEFVVILDNPTASSEVKTIAQKMVALINEPMPLQGNKVHVGTSIGISIYPQDGATPTELMSSADASMYTAKKSGKNTFRFFSSGGDVGAM